MRFARRASRPPDLRQERAYAHRCCRADLRARWHCRRDDAGGRSAPGHPTRGDPLGTQRARLHEHDGARRTRARTVPGAGLARLDQRGLLIVVVATSLEPTDAAVARVNRGSGDGGGIAVVVAGVGGWLLARAALRPVDRMRREVAEISEHDSSAALPVPRTRDEIAALATTLNALLARLQDAIDRQRAFVADAGHELRTPVAVLEVELELAQRPDRSRTDLTDAVGQASQQTARLARLTDELLFLARVDEPVSDERRVLPVQPIVEDATADVVSEAAGRDVRIVGTGTRAPQAPVAPDAVRRAVRNLVANAVRHSPPHTSVTAHVSTDDGTTVIEVQDEGTGFPADFLPHAFERFRRADEARGAATGGTGLGLPIVLAVARATAAPRKCATGPKAAPQ